VLWFINEPTKRKDIPMAKEERTIHENIEHGSSLSDVSVGDILMPNSRLVMSMDREEIATIRKEASGDIIHDQYFITDGGLDTSMGNFGHGRRRPGSERYDSWKRRLKKAGLWNKKGI
jgi:hypothetical protein